MSNMWRYVHSFWHCTGIGQTELVKQRALCMHRLTRDKKRKTVLKCTSALSSSSPSPPSLLSRERERERERDHYYYHIHCHQWYQSTIKFDKDQSVYSRVTLLGNSYRREGPTAVCWSATNELHNLILSNHLSCSYHQWESHHANNVLCQQQCVTNNGLSLCDERPIAQRKALCDVAVVHFF